VFRSNRHIYAQLVDDVSGRTIVAASSLDEEVAREGAKSDVAKRVGALLANRATAAGIGAVVFDRAGYKFHGRVRQLAEGARESGLTF
jgi:large subunit ribosomal protein L18